MNSEKMGKFIASLRKNKNMTQEELAKKLNVTDKAISRWETGKGFPDITIVTKLAKELNVSVAELLDGTNLKTNQIKNEKLVNIIDTTVDYSIDEIRRNRFKDRKKLILIFITSFILLLISISFIFDYKLYLNGETPIFTFYTKKEFYGQNFENSITTYFGLGYKIIKYEGKFGRNDMEFGTYFLKVKNINIDDNVYNDINEYLLSLNDNIKGYDDYKCFVSFKIFGTNQTKTNKLEIDMWVLNHCYYKDNNEIISDSASSIPHKIYLVKDNNTYKIVNYQIPKDGGYYENDMKKLFSKSVRIGFDNFHSKDYDILKSELMTQAKSYYTDYEIPPY